MHHTKSARFALPATLAALPLALAGCGGGSSTPGTPLSASAPVAAGLTARISEPSASVQAGGTATYTLTLTNATAQAVTFESQGLGVQITDAAGRLVYPTVLSSIPPPPPEAVTLQPGQSQTSQVPVSGVLTSPGSYRVRATFYVNGQTTTAGPLTTNVP